jgi:hypothetical protein
METNEYDGMWFLPNDEDESGETLKLAYFTFNDEYANGIPEDSTAFGDMWHIAFFKKNDDGSPQFDDAFEAIFGDPTVYVKGLSGSGLYGCVVRKTNKSGKWFQDYLTKVIGHVMIKKLSSYAKSIADT